MDIILYTVFTAAGLLIGWIATQLRANTLKSKLNAKISSLQIETQHMRENHQMVEKLLSESEEQISKAREKILDLSQKNAVLEQSIKTERESRSNIEDQFKAEFQNLATKIMEDKSKKFTEVNSKNWEDFINPLKKDLKEFKEKVDQESKERFSLSNTVMELKELNQTLSDDAQNLTKALKSDSKAQGNWGEVILERVLESSGLTKGLHYQLQEELKDQNGNPIKSTEDGKKMRPDAIVNYPDNRRVIIDSKVSIKSFTEFVEETDPEKQKKHLEAHVKSVKNHILGLSTKAYDQYDKSLDFVLMFIPNESAYAAAMHGDPELWDFAYSKRIMLISQANLLVSLKVIQDLWKREDQSQNAIEIARRGGLLFDKLVGFLTDLKNVGLKIDDAQAAYIEAKKKLSTGKGNAITQAQTMKELGVNTKKSIPTEFMDQEILTIDDGKE